MPTTREFRKKHAKPRMAHYSASEPEEKSSRPKRRPGRERGSESVEAGELDDHTEDHIGNHKDEHVESHTEDGFQATKTHGKQTRQKAKRTRDEIEKDAEATEGNRIEIHFKGSELLRAKFPKTFDLAEQVATHWVHDGDFEGLPIGHPLGQWAAQQGLTRAKKLEKKILESPLVEKAAVGIFTAGLRAQGILQKVREKIRH